MCILKTNAKLFTTGAFLTQQISVSGTIPQYAWTGFCIFFPLGGGVAFFFGDFGAIKLLPFVIMPPSAGEGKTV